MLHYGYMGLFAVYYNGVSFLKTTKQLVILCTRLLHRYQKDPLVTILIGTVHELNEVVLRT